jgi:predicted lipoprotein with Yx(FWY)xxD motif
MIEIGLTTVALALGAVFAAMALASSPATVGSASSATLGQRVLVNAKGRTLYVLTPETSRHLLCTSSECLKFWPPLTVPSRGTKLVRGAGVHGRLAIMKRANGMLQVTLNGLPLYRFAEDRASGEVNGQNFKGFGGIWHVLGVSGAPSSAAPMSAPAPTTTTPTTTTPTTTMPTTTTPTTTTPGYTY